MSITRQRSDRLFEGSGSTANPGDIRTSFQRQALTLTCRPAPELTLGAALPRMEIRRSEKGVADLELEGLGDIALFAEVAPWREADEVHWAGGAIDLSGLSFYLGLELPTGEDEDTPVPGVATPSLLQLGSGTWDPILGWHYQTGGEPWSLFHHTTFVLPVGRSGADLAPGETVEVVTGLAYRPPGGRWAASLSLDGLFRGKDELRGKAIKNTGASLWSVTPGLSWRARKHVVLEGTLRLPVYRDVRSVQLAPGPRAQVALTYRF